MKKLLLPLLLATLAGSSSCSSGSSPAAAAPTAAEAPKELTPAEQAAAAIAERKGTTIDAPALLAAFKANEVRADRDYKDKKFFVEGSVNKVGKDLMGHSYVVLRGDEYGILGVQCTLENPEEAAELNPGDRIAIDGKCDGLMMNVLMGDSHVVPTLASLKKQAKGAKKK